ncbi:RNA polymerase sigma factor [Miniphocaeibacter massiliensis]|uniref:RNA polymerase sigma factor n=1 Tax=Miniphocaeibacter massiliensis TaxID=2041841 RepID=UPI000C1C126E|nr:sigma-70 family RNA polymerase sigma factor [Miniphocaeibacter massiliensis]
MIFLMTLAEESGIDVEKFEELYNKYKNLMFHVSYDILKDRAMAEDVVQQAFLKIIDIFDEINFENCNKTRNLFVLISKNLSLNIYRSRKNIEVTYLEDSIINNFKDSKVDFEYENIENEVEKAILSLPDIYSDIIYLKYVQGYSNSEIANLFNLKEGTVRQRLNRGKEKLKEFLSEKGVEF